MRQVVGVYPEESTKDVVQKELACNDAASPNAATSTTPKKRSGTLFSYHTPNAIQAILLLLVLAFNLTVLFVHRRLRQPRSPKDPCRTLLDVAGRVADEIAALLRPIRWTSLMLETSTG